MSQSPGPAYLASLCKGALEAIERHRDAATILGRAPPEHLGRIRGATRLEWLAAASLDRLNRAALETLGDAGYVDLWRTHTTQITRTPVLGPLASAAINIFSSSPRLMRWIGRAWERTTQNYGRVVCVVDEEQRRVELSLVELPPAGRLATVALSMRAGMLGVFDLAKTPGRVEMRADRLGSEGRVDLIGTWD